MLRLALSLLTIALVGCATGPKKVDPQNIVQTGQGFSFKIPMTGEWYTGPATDKVYVFGKKTDSKDMSILAEVRQDQVDSQLKNPKNNKQILDFYRLALIADASGGRIKNTRSDFKQKKFKGTDCLYFNQVGEDLEARGTTYPHMQISFKGILCLHPKDQKKFIRLAVSQRVNMNARFSDLTKDEEAFYNSLEFN